MQPNVSTLTPYARLAASVAVQARASAEYVAAKTFRRPRTSQIKGPNFGLLNAAQRLPSRACDPCVVPMRGTAAPLPDQLQFGCALVGKASRTLVAARVRTTRITVHNSGLANGTPVIVWRRGAPESRLSDSIAIGLSMSVFVWCSACTERSFRWWAQLLAVN